MSILSIDTPRGPVQFGNALPLAFILGPCALESRDHALKMASTLAAMGERLQIPVIYKSSFDKANRTSGTAYRGMGLDVRFALSKEIGRAHV